MKRCGFALFGKAMSLPFFDVLSNNCCNPGHNKKESVLIIRASPRSDGHSNRVADRFLTTLQKERPMLNIKEWWLHDENSHVPEFGQAVINGKRPNASPSEKDIWNKVLGVIDDFKSADSYVIASPMWNFGIPAKLKNLIDVLLQDELTFADDDEGHTQGLLKGKKVLFILARAGEYTPGSPSDFQLPYLRKALSFIGVHNQKAILIENTWMGEKSDGLPLKEAEKLGRDW